MRHKSFIIASLALLVVLAGALFAAPTATQAAAAAVCDTVHTTNLSTWNLSETRAQGHNELVADGLHIWTESNTSLDKAAGYYPLAVNLSTITSASLNYTNSSPALMLPGLQIVVDGDGNGSPDGILVGEPNYYGANWWLSNGSAQFMKDGAPHTGGGNGSNWFGTLSEWSTAFPSAKVVSIGYSLGSGAHGDGVIVSMQFGCHLFTFGLPGSQPPAGTQPVGGFVCRVLVQTPITAPFYGEWLNGSEWADWDGFVVQDPNKDGGIEISLHAHVGESTAFEAYRVIGANGGEIRYFELTGVPGICAEITDPLE